VEILEPEDHSTAHPKCRVECLKGALGHELLHDEPAPLVITC
jgi:hypothetical protein